MLYLSILFSTGSFILKSNAVFGLKKERESPGKKLPNCIQTLPVSFSVLHIDQPIPSAFPDYDHGNVYGNDLVNWDNLMQTFTKLC